jgi:hypothetical protein
MMYYRVMTKLKQTQLYKFKQAARDLEADNDAQRFEIVRANPEARAVVHASDCAIHNAPAMPLGPCTCGAEKAGK